MLKFCLKEVDIPTSVVCQTISLKDSVGKAVKEV